MQPILDYLAQPWMGQAVIGLIGLLALWLILRVGLAWFKAIMESRQQQQPAQQSAPQQSAPAPVQTETSARMGWNMLIAKTHESATQVIAIQIAGANLLAIGVSACSVVGGMVVLASQQYPGNYLLWFAAGGVGLGLAVLIEGITISSLIRIRNAGPAIRKAMAQWEKEFDAAKQQDAQRYYSDKQYRRALNRDFADRKKRYVRPHEKKRGASIPFAFLGAIASATAGGLFYHTILQSLETWVAFAISGLLAVVVTGTFVSQELFREDQEEAIREGFKGGSLTLAAIKEETKRISMQEIYASLRSYMQSEEARNTINAKLLEMLVKALDDITESTVEQFRTSTINENKTDAQLAQPQPAQPETQVQSAQSQAEQQASTPEPAPQEPVVSARAYLGSIEGMMYDKVIEHPEVLAGLQQILETSGVPGVTSHLKKQYKAEAFFITEARVSKVMDALYQDKMVQASAVITPESQEVIGNEKAARQTDALPAKEADASTVKRENQEESHTEDGERDTDAISIVAARLDEAAQDLASEYTDVIINYPGIAQAWLAKGVKSVSAEEIIAVTGLSRQKVQYHAKRSLAKTPKNPSLYTVASVLKWLQSMPVPMGNTVETKVVSPTNGNGHNGHLQMDQTPQEILEAQLEEMSVN